jgi:hypothetical protein
MADGELLRAYFQSRLEPGDLDSKSKLVYCPAPLLPGGTTYYRRVGPERKARIIHVREGLRRQCAAGELVLWGRRCCADGLGPVQPIVVPLPEWRPVRFFPKTSRVRYLNIEYVAVEVRAPEMSAEISATVQMVATTSPNKPGPKPGVSGKERALQLADEILGDKTVRRASGRGFSTRLAELIHKRLIAEGHIYQLDSVKRTLHEHKIKYPETG